MEAKKRIAMVKKDGVMMKLEYKFLTDEEFEKCLDELSKKTNVDVGSIITYDLGTRDDVEEGTMYFCPKCGEYNEFGHEPNVREFYQKDPETGKLKPAGYHKNLTLECYSCDETFEIYTEQFEKESEKLTKLMFEQENLS